MDLPRDAYQGQVFSAELQEPKVHSDHQRSQVLISILKYYCIFYEMVQRYV